MHTFKSRIKLANLPAISSTRLPAVHAPNPAQGIGLPAAKPLVAPLPSPTLQPAASSPAQPQQPSALPPAQPMQPSALPPAQAKTAQAQVTTQAPPAPPAPPPPPPGAFKPSSVLSAASNPADLNVQRMALVRGQMVPQQPLPTPESRVASGQQAQNMAALNTMPQLKTGASLLPAPRMRCVTSPLAGLVSLVRGGKLIKTALNTRIALEKLAYGMGYMGYGMRPGGFNQYRAPMLVMNQGYGGPLWGPSGRTGGWGGPWSTTGAMFGGGPYAPPQRYVPPWSSQPPQPSPEQMWSPRRSPELPQYQPIQLDQLQSGIEQPQYQPIQPDQLQSGIQRPDTRPKAERYPEVPGESMQPQQQPQQPQQPQQTAPFGGPPKALKFANHRLRGLVKLAYLPRRPGGMAGMPMFRGMGGMGGFGGRPGGVMMGPASMLPMANPFTGQAGAGAGPPGMGGYDPSGMGGTSPSWHEPWSTTGAAFGGQRATARQPGAFRGQVDDPAARDRSSRSMQPTPFDAQPTPAAPTPSAPEGPSADLQQHYADAQESQRQLAEFHEQSRQRQIALSRQGLASQGQRAGAAVGNIPIVGGLGQALATGAGNALAGSSGDAMHDPALAGLRNNPAYQQASPEQRAELERNYAQANPYRMSAQQLQQDPHFQLMLNGAQGAQQQQHAQRMLSMSANPQAWQGFMSQYQQRYGNAPGATGASLPAQESSEGGKQEGGSGAEGSFGGKGPEQPATPPTTTAPSTAAAPSAMGALPPNGGAAFNYGAGYGNQSPAPATTAAAPAANAPATPAPAPVAT